MSDGIGLPDHPVRHTVLWQIFDRLWRPTMGWVCVAALAYAAIIGPAIGRPLEDGYLVQVLLFIGGVYGAKSYEKLKGVA